MNVACRIGAAMVFGLFVQACGSDGTDRPTAASPLSTSQDVSASIDTPTPRYSAPATPSNTSVLAPTVSAAPTPPTKLPDDPQLIALGAPDAPDPMRLIGKDQSVIRYLLGDPDFRRQESHAEIWQYRDRSCILDLFLYAEKHSAAVTVAHVDVRAGATTKPAPSACLSVLLKNHWLNRS